MKRIRVMQQALDPTGYGGVSVEYRALMASADLGEKYEFIPLILKDHFKGINIRAIKFYYQNIKKEQPDMVHVRGAAIDGLNAEIAVKLAGKAKLLVCVHGMYSDMVNFHPVKKWIARHIIEPLCFMLADGISCVYEEGANRSRYRKYQRKMLPHVYNRMPDYSQYDVDGNRVEFRKQYQIPDDAVVGVFCGRVTKEKGLEYLVEMFDGLQECWPEKLHFVIVGDGDYRAQMEEACRPYSANVHFTGSATDVRPALAASDFFVFPSLHENHSIALLEAMEMKLPCVATNVDGNPEIVKDGKFGILIEPYNVQQLEAAVIKMLLPDVREQFAAEIKAYSFAEFKNDAIDKQLDRVYQILLG